MTGTWPRPGFKKMGMPYQGVRVERGQGPPKFFFARKFPISAHISPYKPIKRPQAQISLRGGQLSSNSPPKFLLAISTETMVRMSTLVVLLRTSDRKLAFYAAIALKATELIIML